MTVIEEAIDVNAPIGSVYDQWTEVCNFPRFMKGIKEVRQLDHKRSRWRAEIAGREKLWEAQITQEILDERVCWRSTSGAFNIGSVSFYSLGDGRTKIILWMMYDPVGLVENVASLVGIIANRVTGDLERFKRFIESRGTNTSAWSKVTNHRHRPEIK
jgi:uncharacterized membrane protein